MKKYISSILINTLLIQLAGCYSQREITFEEFYSMPKTEEVTIEIKNGDTFDLDSDSLRHDYIKWEKREDTVTFYPTHLEKYTSTGLIEVTDTVKYPKEDISKIYIDEFDQSKTVVLIISSAILIGLIIYGISTMEFEMEGWEW